MPKIVFCQATFRDDFEGTKRCIERVSPNVDATVIVYDQTLTEEQIGWLHENAEKYRIYPVPHEFRDDLPEMRNAYLRMARELGADWVCVSDPDELYSEELAKNLRRLIERYDAEGYNLLPVPARDQFDNVEWLDDVELLKEVPGGYREVDYWKPLLIFKLYPDTHYEGVGAEGKVHETLRSGVPWKPMNLPREYYYTHMKSALRIWRNACLTPDSMIITDKGLKRVDEVQVGDLVYSKDGRFHRVLDCWKRIYKGRVIRLRSHYGIWVGLTPDHKVMALSSLEAYRLGLDKGAGRTSGAHNYKPEWTVAERCKEELFAFPKPAINKFTLQNIPVTRLSLKPEGRRRGIDTKDPDFWYFLGYWLAEGSFSHRREYEYVDKQGATHKCKYVNLSMNVEDRAKERIIRIIKDKFNRKPSLITRGRLLAITFGHKELADFLENTFGRGSSEKRIPMDFLGLQKRFLVSLIEGLMHGDGTEKPGGGWVLSTVNSSFVAFLALALIKYNIVPSIVEVPPTNFKKGKGFHHKKKIYRIGVSPKEWEALLLSKKGFNLKTRNRLCWNDGKYIYIPTYKKEKLGYIEEQYEGPVYDLTVENEESFATPFIVLHNSRNLYIAGGGDNVGSLNRYWVRLRQICSRLGIKTWNEFEEFVRRGTDDEEFHGWLKDALQAPPTSWGTETRECAKWYFALHGEQITPEVRRLIETRPALTPEIEAENYVTSMYFKILGRHPDEEGKRHYTQLILEGKMSREDLPKILMASDEYRARSAGVPSAPGVVERMKVQVPVDVYVRLDERTFVEALRRSRVYWEVVKPKIDVGDLILGRLSPVKQAEFKRWFYGNRDAIGPRDIAEWVEENMMRPNSIALCIMGFDGALPMIVENIKVTGPYVDEIHVQGDDFSEGSVRILEDLGAEVHIVPWEDNFSDYKNKAISYANTEWVLICDHDEIPTEEMARALRGIVERSDRGRRYNMVSFDVVDVWTEDGKVVSENRSSGGKALLHWNVPEPYYGNPHIWLKPNYYPWKAVHVPYAYRHVKDRGSILPNSVRNVFLGGGGDNVRERNPLWVELRILTRELGIDTWRDFHRYLKRGDIDDRILNVLRRMAEMPWKDDELKDPLRYYYHLHPEERDR
jgi:intein/homing endonuclease